MKNIAILTVAALALLTAPTATLAAGQKHCPPGLAKKSPACVPPGQAKKGVTAEEWANRSDGYDVGDHIDDPEYVVLAEGDRVIFEGREYVVIDTDNGTILRRDGDFYRLPRIGDGSDYVRIGDSIIKVDRETKQVIDFIRLADLIFS
ncbi:MAG: hypothetical protein GKR98_04285 [Boseongicola sp.]|nr:MAG: hypothetical protein GKR98_04285 [Boseongicola sp.]